MTKLLTVFVFVALTTNIQGAPVSPYDDIVEAATQGQWEKFQSLIFEKFGPDGWKEVKPSSVRSLQPPKGGHVYGESEYTFHSSSDFNGQKEEKSGGHKIINEDGKVKEFDFKPDFDFKSSFDFKPNFDFKTLLDDSSIKEIPSNLKEVQ